MRTRHRQSPALAARGSEVGDLAGGSISPPNIIADTQDQHARHVAYVDVIQVWVQRPLAANRLKWLSTQCAKPLLGGWHLRDGPPRWDRSRTLRQGPRLMQPSEAALHDLAQRQDVLVTYAEPAFDYSCDQSAKIALARTFGENFVQRWHGGRRTVLWVNGNGRTARRGSLGPCLQWYIDRPSKLTDTDCFHLELQLQGGRALRQSGIESISDLLALDYPGLLHRYLDNAFWVVDLDRLGRHHANRRDGTKRRRQLKSDAILGSRLYKLHAAHPNDSHESVQQFVDTYGRGPYLLTFLCNGVTTFTQTPSTTSTHSIKPRPPQDVEDGKRYPLGCYLNSIDNVTLDFLIHDKEEVL